MALVYPVLAQIALTLALILATGVSRVRAVKAGEVRIEDVALASEAYPVRIRQLGNAMNNQFETPILFYALCGVAALVGATGWRVVRLAWFNVGGRRADSSIHVTSNDVVRRFHAFTAGIVALIAMWIVIVVTLVAR
jgi:hypothetical protein